MSSAETVDPLRSAGAASLAERLPSSPPAHAAYAGGLAGGPHWGRLNVATSVCAFMVPGLALWVRSGYSWGAVLLLVLALVTLHRWPRQRIDSGSALWVAVILAMGLVWVVQGDASLGAARWDRFSKLLLALPCVFYAVAYPPGPRAITFGLMVGCWGAGAVAMWEVYGQGLPRADGYTNAIQFGNLALLLGVLAVIHLLCFFRYLSGMVRIGLVLAIGLAVQASVLSLTRGGWVALVLLPLMLLALPRRRLHGLSRWHWLVGLAALLVLAIPVAMHVPAVVQRLDLLTTEVHAYQSASDASTSIGHRLEHWRLAWHMGLERPLVGWGDVGYEAEKARLVSAGLFHAFTTYFGHAHNEVLDLFAKRGLVGVAMLLAFYAVPLALFWPTRRRMVASPSGVPGATPGGWLRQAAWALRLSGVAMVLMYVGFGWTQVFFAHNSGTMFYVFMLTLCWAALRGVERGHVPAVWASPDAGQPAGSASAASGMPLRGDNRN